MLNYRLITPSLLTQKGRVGRGVFLPKIDQKLFCDCDRRPSAATKMKSKQIVLNPIYCGSRRIEQNEMTRFINYKTKG